MSTLFDEILIRKAKIEELNDILALQKRAFHQEAYLYNDFTISPLHQSIENIVQEFSDKEIFVACLNSNEIIGSIRISRIESKAFVSKLIVDPIYQNKGVGRKLMLFIENHFMNIKTFELFTGELSEKNIHLYQSLDYSITHTIPENDTINLVVMKKTIR